LHADKRKPEFLLQFLFADKTHSATVLESLTEYEEREAGKNLWLIGLTKSKNEPNVISAITADAKRADDAIQRILDDMRPEYDFRGGVRGKYYKQYMEGTNVVLLDRDVASVFRDSESVNEALRVLIKAAGQLKRTNSQKAEPT
jgi:hypothetical protein